jgi:protein O-GlcNAc transferase
MLMNAGLSEFVANNANEYLSRAVELCEDPRQLAGLRANLRKQVLASPIFDAERFAYHFENALRGMWKKWCRQQA